MTQPGDTVPFRGRGSWTPSARLHAAGQLRSRLLIQRTAFEIATVGAEYFHELFTARTVTVSTLEAGQYEDLVSIGYLPPREQFYPAESTYAASLFPLAVKELDEHQGYFTSDLTDPNYAEFVGSRDDIDVASIMGVAMVTAGTLRGEVFCTRSHDQHAFDREDLELARDLSTSFASMLMTALHGSPTET
jgi:GAF domain-containing protein